MVKLIKVADRPAVKIGVVAKYMDHDDTYMSVFEALRAAGWNNGVRPDIDWIDAEALTTKNAAEMLKGFAGLVVPGTFGARGVEGEDRGGAVAASARSRTWGSASVCRRRLLRWRVMPGSSRPTQPRWTRPHPTPLSASWPIRPRSSTRAVRCASGATPASWSLVRLRRRPMGLSASTNVIVAA